MQEICIGGIIVKTIGARIIISNRAGIIGIGEQPLKARDRSHEERASLGIAAVLSSSLELSSMTSSRRELSTLPFFFSRTSTLQPRSRFPAASANIRNSALRNGPRAPARCTGGTSRSPVQCARAPPTPAVTRVTQREPSCAIRFSFTYSPCSVPPRSSPVPMHDETILYASCTLFFFFFLPISFRGFGCDVGYH